MTLTAWGHSCVVVEVATTASNLLRVLVDPGNFTVDIEAVGHIDAVLVTHAHPDHVDPGHVATVRGGKDIPVYGSAATCSLLSDAGVPDAIQLEAGPLDLGGLVVTVVEHDHETIYPGVPLPENFALDFGGRILAPGDSFQIPATPVEVLLLPTGAPWMKLSETIDYLRAVAPRIAVPVHDGGLAAPHREMHQSLMVKFAPDGTAVMPLGVGESLVL